MKPKMIIVLTTVPSREVAAQMSQKLVKEKLVACVNVISNVHSLFFWEAELEYATEVILLMKTQESRYQALEEAILKIHPYNTPEIIAIPVIAAVDQYAAWVHRETTPPTKS